MALEAEGFTVTAIPDGADAATIVESRAVDLVVDRNASATPGSSTWPSSACAPSSAPPVRAANAPGRADPLVG